MTAIWHDDGSGWKLLTPTGFPDEVALHTLVEQAPQTLPLAGAPRLIILGREVSLGNGSADLLGIEPTGRLAVIEVKLAHNAEVRRAVVAQVLDYAAYLHGLDRADLEQQVLTRHLRKRGHQSLEAIVEAGDQEGTFDAEAFDQGLRESLAQGRFRLVLIVDDAPRELVRLELPGDSDRGQATHRSHYHVALYGGRITDPRAAARRRGAAFGGASPAPATA